MKIKISLNKPKAYIGDGVYAEVERGMLKLTTEDGYGETNTIYLEPEIIAALQSYLNKTNELYNCSDIS